MEEDNKEQTLEPNTKPTNQQPPEFDFNIWLDHIHMIFSDKPIFLLLKVELKETEGKFKRVVGVEGISPSADSLAFMNDLKDKKNPLAG